MIVKELIEQLQRLDKPDSTVFIDKKEIDLVMFTENEIIIKSKEDN